MVNECYEAWWTLQCRVDDYYAERERQRPPLSQQKEFRQIKNTAIREAENIRLGVITFEDEGIEAEDEPEEAAGISYDFWALRDIVQNDDLPMAERDESVVRLQRLAEGGEAHAQYLTGKLWRDGPLLTPDWVNARYWFTQAAEQGSGAAQYALGKLLLSNDPEVRDPDEGLRWLKQAAQSGSHYAAYRLGKLYLQGEQVPKDMPRALEYLTTSAERGNQYAQFFLEHFDEIRSPSVFLAATKLLHHMGQIFRENSIPPAAPVGQQTGRKLRRRIREKKIALGHKPDDHEETVQSGPTMSL